MSGNTFTRREAIKTMGGISLAAMLGNWSLRADSPKPNIIFVMTDDHAAHALSCYGSKINTTPNLDRIAHEGIRFTNCFVTNSLCAPSRATILTGKYSHINGVEENLFGDKAPFDGSQQTFPKLLRKAGYKTAMVGKWHLKSDPTGFDYWNVLPGQGRYNNPVFVEMGEKKQYKGYVTDITTDIGIQTIEKLKDDGPFCLMLHHKPPHRGWHPDEKHAHMYDDEVFPEPETFNDDYKNRASAAAHADMRVANMPDFRKEMPKGLTPEEQKKWNYQKYMRRYLGVIASVDENMGRLLDYLDEAGLTDNTLLIYTTDNGFFLGEHGWFDKRFMYEESLRIPLLVRYPREIKAGSVDSHMVSNLDFAETFLDYAGAGIPNDMQGRSLRPLLEGQEPADWRKSHYYHYYEYPGPHKVYPNYGVRTERYKLIHYDMIDEWEMFDLEKDPNELNSVYNDPNYADVQKELKAELNRLRRRYKDTI